MRSRKHGPSWSLIGAGWVGPHLQTTATTTPAVQGLEERLAEASNALPGVRWREEKGESSNPSEIAARLVEMTQPWWTDRGVRADLQLNGTQPVRFASHRLLGPLVNVVVALTGRLGPGDALRIVVWQAVDYTHFLFCTNPHAATDQSYAVERSAVRSRLAMARATLRKIGGRLSFSEGDGRVEVLFPLSPLTRPGGPSH
ncbi:MAG: hypothetical protein J7M26_05525 [Armatimonadetes bacterium]|nr:hypothetical protein [Armatimonadota bacterium]